MEVSGWVLLWVSDSLVERKGAGGRGESTRAGKGAFVGFRWASLVWRRPVVTFRQDSLVWRGLRERWISDGWLGEGAPRGPLCVLIRRANGGGRGGGTTASRELGVGQRKKAVAIPPLLGSKPGRSQGDRQV